MSKGSKFALGALIGGLAGLVAGLLAAPKSGKETRQDLRRKADELKKTAEVTGKDVSKKARQTAEDATVRFRSTADDMADQADELKARAKNAVRGAQAGFAKDPEAARRR